jgi:hypothetical protein
MKSLHGVALMAYLSAMASTVGPPLLGEGSGLRYGAAAKMGSGRRHRTTGRKRQRRAAIRARRKERSAR